MALVITVTLKTDPVTVPVVVTAKDCVVTLITSFEKVTVKFILLLLLGLLSPDFLIILISEAVASGVGILREGSSILLIMFMVSFEHEAKTSKNKNIVTLKKCIKPPRAQQD